MNFFGGSSSNDAHAFESPVDRILKSEKRQPLFGPLEPQDTEWAQHGGFVTETQVWYATLPDGQVIMFQIIHSAVGLWSPTVQITFAHFDGKQRAWRSVNVSHFTTPASPSLDKRSCKGDQFSVVLDPKEPDCYKIQATYDKDTQLTLNVTRSPNVPGWKLGTGSRGGISYFGSVKPEKQSSKGYMPDRDAGADGYAVHRFWPSASVTGVVRIGQTMLDLAGSSGIFIHAVQGRRPNLLASRWNFADFQSIPKSPEEDQVSLIMMEFTTTAQHKHAKVNAGSIVVNGELVAVTMGGPPQVTDGNKAEHQDLALDKDTGYNAPKTVSFEWSGPAIADPSKTVKANIKLDATQGLAEKVDVLAEIPYFIKKVVNVVSGAKPYVYQWFNPREATIELPELNGKPARTVQVQGYLFNEISYVSEDP